MRLAAQRRRVIRGRRLPVAAARRDAGKDDDAKQETKREYGDYAGGGKGGHKSFLSRRYRSVYLLKRLVGKLYRRGNPEATVLDE
jgi:hypothetical protein